MSSYSYVGTNRRCFLQSLALASTALVTTSPLRAAEPSTRPRICAFTKYIQSYSFEEMAEKLAEAGFDGLEATVRPGGYIEPEHAPDRLPRLVEVLDRHGLKIDVLCSNVTRVDQPHTEALLRTAAELGIPCYRMGYYRYDLDKAILPQLAAIQPVIDELAVFNRELGIQAVYQNHSGTNFVGAPVWDLERLLADIPPEEIAVAFDICHATIEAGLSWPVQYRLMQPHLGAVFVKDFVWDDNRAVQKPLGEGRIEPRFFEMLQQDGFTGPYSLHVEYLGGGTTEENYQALVRDLKLLREWVG